MHKDDEIPLVPDTASMQDALLTMTSKMLGCVGIVDNDGRLEGIITDGDLRRCMSADIFNKKAADIMTRNPKTIEGDMLVAEALKTMNEKHITQLFVLKDRKPVGILHMHDCLRIGVA